MATIDFLEYFIVKERLVDLSHREYFALAKNGDDVEKTISDMYLARKVVYQQCKSADSLTHLHEILDELEREIPEISICFDQIEFEKAWNMTIKELRSKFKKK